MSNTILSPVYGVPAASASQDGAIITSPQTLTAGQIAQVWANFGVSAPLNFRGNIDCSTNPNYPAASSGWFYICSVAGKIGGVSGVSVEVGDAIVCNTTNSGGDQATVGADWFILEHSLQGALLSANNLSDVASVSSARTNLGLGTAATQNSTAFDAAGAAAAAQASAQSYADSTKLALSGGTMTGAIAMGSNKITGIANGTASSDAAAFGQIPTSFPPSGAAGGDLAGSTFPNPIIAANAVTNAKAAQMPTLTLKGNNSGITANASDLTVSQAQSMLGVSGGPFLPLNGSAAMTGPLAIQNTVLQESGANSSQHLTVTFGQGSMTLAPADAIDNTADLTLTSSGARLTMSGTGGFANGGVFCKWIQTSTGFAGLNHSAGTGPDGSSVTGATDHAVSLGTVTNHDVQAFRNSTVAWSVTASCMQINGTNGYAFGLPSMTDTAWGTITPFSGWGYWSSTSGRYKIYDGSITQTVAWITDVPISCLNIQGDDSNGNRAYMRADAPSALAVTSYTIQAWVFLASTGGLQVVMGVTNGFSGSNIAYTLQVTSAGILVAEHQNGSSDTNVSSTGAVSWNAWNHIAVTYNTSGKAVAFYINGVSAGTGTLSFDPSYNTTYTKSVSVGAFRSQYNTVASDAAECSGSICDARIFNVVRTSGQILADYQSGRTYPANATGEVARWKLNDGAGTTAKDSISSTNLSYTQGTGLKRPWSSL